MVLLAGEMLKMAKPFVEDGVHPQVIIRSFRQAASMAVTKISELAEKIEKDNPEQLRNVLERCAATTLSSKLVAHQRHFFSKLVVDAVSTLDDHLPLDMIGIKLVPGGALEVCASPGAHPPPTKGQSPPLERHCHWHF